MLSGLRGRDTDGLRLRDCAAVKLRELEKERLKRTFCVRKRGLVRVLDEWGKDDDDDDDNVISVDEIDADWGRATVRRLAVDVVCG